MKRVREFQKRRETGVRRADVVDELERLSQETKRLAQELTSVAVRLRLEQEASGD